MTVEAAQLLRDALELSEEDRMELMTALSDSFKPPPAELSPEWKQELENRIDQLERGEVEPVSWDDVEATIRATLARR
ncbi:MAG: addiction module protein [Myxococcota bacterium]